MIRFKDSQGGYLMRGNDTQQGAMFSYLSPERRVPADHPLRPIRQMVDTVLKRLSPRFEAMYAEGGRPSIPPEKHLRALLLQCLDSVRSERLLMEQLDYNLLFPWFVGLNMDDLIWDFTVFSKNRQRLREADLARAFFVGIGQLAREHGLLSDEHFTVDGTLIEAWAGQKSLKPRTGTPPSDSDARNPSVNFRGQKRTNDTHASTTDPDARLYKKVKGQEAKLAFLGHVLMENRNGLVVETRLTKATGTAERETSLEIVGRKRKQKQGRLILGGDKNYDTSEHVRRCAS
jgi:transposase